MLHLQPSADFSFFANHFLTFGSLCGGVQTKTHNGFASWWGRVTIVCFVDLCIRFLVLMECSLTFSQRSTHLKLQVLILVLMECSLTKSNWFFCDRDGCLNPCSNGILSDVRFEGNQIFVEKS